VQNVADPVVLLRSYTHLRDLRHHARSPLFLRENGTHPSRSWFHRKFFAILDRSFGGQSARAGGATFYASLGISEDILQALVGGHHPPGSSTFEIIPPSGWNINLPFFIIQPYFRVPHTPILLDHHHPLHSPHTQKIAVCFGAKISKGSRGHAGSLFTLLAQLRGRSITSLFRTPIRPHSDSSDCD
jgi:hypothetical protein